MAPIWRRKRKRKAAWIADYRDASGVRRRLTASTRQAAEDLLAEKIQETRRGFTRSAVTLTEYKQRWLERIAATLAPRTLRSYRELLEQHVLPTLGASKLQEIRRRHVKDLLADKSNAGLSKNTVRLIRTALSVLLGDAVDDELLEVNVALGAGRRGRRRPDTMSPIERRRAIQPLTYEQLATFLSVTEARGSRLEATLFLSLADAGLRPGEAFALRWEDVSQSDRTLRVERAISAGRVKLTKTEDSRVVDLTARLAQTLALLQASVEAGTLLGDHIASPWIFPSAAGTPLDESKVAKRFRELRLAAGLPHCRLYDLRHSFASHLLAEGAPITYVAAQLGHRKPTTTLAFYAHWIPRGDKSHIDRLAAARQAVAPKVLPVALDDTDAGKAWHQSGAISKKVETTEAEVPENWSRRRDLNPRPADYELAAAA